MTEKTTNEAILLFAEHANASTYWGIIFLFSITVAIGTPFAIEKAMKTPEEVLVHNPTTGTIVLTSLEDFNNSELLISDMAVRAAETIFERSFAGPDHPERIGPLFTSKTQPILERYWNSNINEFESKQIKQTMELNSLTISEPLIVDAYKEYSVVLKGALIKEGIIEGVKFREPTSFTLQLRLVRNPKMRENEKYPLVCRKFKPVEYNPQADVR